MCWPYRLLSFKPPGWTLSWAFAIEYGFVDGELTLFQIRPLVERGPQLANRIVAALVPASAAQPPASVALDLPPGN
jgi:hypothetical protein